MEWTDEGIVLGVRRHGESSTIVELLTRSHGRHLGLVRGGAGKRMRPLLQPGNSVTTVWRARLDEHLGYYAIEGTRLRAATLLTSAHATYGVTHLASLVRLLPGCSIGRIRLLEPPRTRPRCRPWLRVRSSTMAEDSPCRRTPSTIPSSVHSMGRVYHVGWAKR
jgi:hypothetical protein